MSLCFFLKLLSEISLYYVAANSALSITLTGVESLIPTFICAAVGALGFWMEEKHSSKRIFILPLLLTVFFFGKTFGTYLAVGLPALYVGMLIWQKRYFIDHDSHVDFFRVGMMVACVLSVPFVFLMKLDYIIPFIILFLLSAIFTLRLIRQDAEIFNETKFRMLNLLTVGGIMLLTLFISSDAFLSFSGMVLGKIYNILIVPIFYAVYAFGYSIYYLIYQILLPHANTDSTNQFNSNLGDFMQENMGQQLEEELVNGDPFLMILRGVFLIVGVLLVILMVYRNSKGRSRKEEGSVREARSSVTIMRPEEKIYADRIPPREPRAAVRYYYRNFLRLCQNLGHEFPKFYNSKTIENTVSHQFDENTLKTMRQTYIRARYSEHEITKDDVSNMKAQVKKLKAQTSDMDGIRTDGLHDKIRDSRILNTTSETFGKGPDSKMRYNTKL